MPGVPFWWFTSMTSRTALEKSLFMAFVMVLPWRWLLCKFIPAMIFGFFPLELRPLDTLEIMSAWLRISSTLPTLQPLFPRLMI